MKRQVLMMMTVLALFTTLAILQVEAQNAGNMTVSIPFDFSVSGKTLPAGDYLVQRSSQGGRIVTQIRNGEKVEAVYLQQTHAVQKNEIQPESKLVFNKYGNQYFLSQVWLAGRSSGEELARSNRERILQHETARSLHKPETVAVVGRSN